MDKPDGTQLWLYTGEDKTIDQQVLKVRPDISCYIDLCAQRFLQVKLHVTHIRAVLHKSDTTVGRVSSQKFYKDTAVAVLPPCGKKELRSQFDSLPSPLTDLFLSHN